MATYVRVPTEEIDSPVFDYSSPFTFTSANASYRSINTYSPGSSTNQLVSSSPSSTRERQLNLAEKCFLRLLVFACYACIVLTAPISLFFVMKRIPQYERIVVFRLGRMQPIKGPGTVFILPLVDRHLSVDLRMRAFVVPPQFMILSDDAIVEIGAEIRFRITNIRYSTLHVKDLDASLRVLGRSVFVNNLTKKCLNDLQKHKEDLTRDLIGTLNEQVAEWGLQVVRVEFSPLRVTQDAQHHPGLSRLLGALSNTFDNPSKAVAAASSASASFDDPIEQYLKRIKRASEQSVCFKDVDGCFCLRVNRDGQTREYNFAVQDGHVQLEPSSRSPDVTVTICEDDLLKIFSLELSPLGAYIANKLDICGDVQLVTNLGSALKSIKHTSIINL
uniref:Band 7 domain-containing protein n=1 Tax=Strigamia maritima TaxID=126957 RepID=T1INT7_STRMM